MPGVFRDDLPKPGTLQNRFYFYDGLQAVPVKTGVGGMQSSQPFQLVHREREQPVKKIPVYLFNILLCPFLLALQQFVIEDIKTPVGHHFSRLSEGGLIIPGRQ